MLKRMLVAATVTGLIAGASVSVQAAPTPPGEITCKAAAKAKYPQDRTARVAYKKECKAHWKAYQTAHGKSGLFKKAA
jgi:hypothetical protein